VIQTQPSPATVLAARLASLAAPIGAVLALALVFGAGRPAAAREAGVAGDARASAAADLVLPTDDPAERLPLAVPEPTPLAVQYHRTGMVLWGVARLWDVAVPLALLLTGASAWLRDRARRIGRAWLPTVAVYIVFYLVVSFLADLPLAYYAGYVRQHAYGLSRQTFAKWFGDSLKALGVEAVGGACFGWVPFLLIRRWPRSWWLVTAALSVPFTAFVVLIAPVWIDPLFNNFGPMTDRSLESKILALAERAGVSGGRVFQVDKSVDTVAANAYVKGLFGTKRIVLWDTLLENFDDREVLAVMGHEMGHYTLNHIPRAIALSSLILAVSLFWTDRAGRWLIARYQRRFGFDSLADVAATPLLLILMAVSSTVLGPVALAYSRHCEREADRFSLDLTHMNRSSARAFAGLLRQNLSVPYHHPIETLWRSTHPSIAERIEFSNTYRPWDERRR
jgi:Zn-dependent protease with chaperone function